MKCVARVVNGQISEVTKVANGFYTENGSCIYLKKVYNPKTLEDDLVPTVRPSTPDGLYFVPKSVWKQKVRDAHRPAPVPPTKKKEKKQ